MRYGETVNLVSATNGVDDDGYPTVDESKREVFADVRAVKRSEFYTAKQAGVELALSVVIWACDYEGERLLDYDGKRYRVERTYTKDGEMLELNCSENKGAVL